MASTLISGATVIDPARDLEARADVLIDDGKIVCLDDGSAPCARQMAAELAARPGCARVDAAGKTVTPGLIDMHVHFREPGMEEEETIASGAAAAVAGGFTSVVCMPNTEPAMDSEAHMNFVLRESKAHGLAEVYPAGAITAGRKGEALAEMGNMARGGAVAFSDDGKAVASAAVLRQALSYAKMLDLPVLEHCEEPTLAAGGVMNESYVSTVLGLPGIPAEAEEIIVSRDVHLAKLTGARLHIQHVSTRGSIAIVRRARAAGLRVSAEVTPHHLTLNEENLRSYDQVYKVNPPLRGQEDVDACVAALADGTLEVIASDHAPHLREEKEMEMAQAPFGLMGLETSFSVVYTELVRTGKVPLATVVRAMTAAPARVLGLPRGTLAPGAAANLTIWDLGAEWTVDPARFRSKSVNCPWNGRQLFARPVAVYVQGEDVLAKLP